MPLLLDGGFLQFYLRITLTGHEALFRSKDSADSYSHKVVVLDQRVGENHNSSI